MTGKGWAIFCEKHNHARDSSVDLTKLRWKTKLETLARYCHAWTNSNQAALWGLGACPLRAWPPSLCSYTYYMHHRPLPRRRLWEQRLIKKLVVIILEVGAALIKHKNPNSSLKKRNPHEVWKISRAKGKEHLNTSFCSIALVCCGAVETTRELGAVARTVLYSLGAILTATTNEK